MDADEKAVFLHKGGDFFNRFRLKQRLATQKNNGADERFGFQNSFLYNFQINQIGPIQQAVIVAVTATKRAAVEKNNQRGTTMPINRRKRNNSADICLHDGQLGNRII